MRTSLSGLFRLLAAFALVALAWASTDGEPLGHDVAAAATTEGSSPPETVRVDQAPLRRPYFC
jgi:hypothetical protein